MFDSFQYCIFVFYFQAKDEDKFPEILNTLLKQKYTINLVITKENLTKGSTIYQAKDVVVQVETVGNHDPNTIRTVEKNVAEMEEISVVNVIFGHLMFKFHILGL